MFKNKLQKVINIFIVLVLFSLPYLIFNGKLFIGGDDSRLFYIYPLEWIKNIIYFSWYNFSSIGVYNPNQFLIPLLFFIQLIKVTVHSLIVIDYFMFSLPLILGYIFMQKFLSSIFENTKITFIESLLGSLFYVFSPILIVNQYSPFLYSAWLIALTPICAYYFTAYLRTSNFTFIIKNLLFCLFFSLAFYAIPWFLGVLFPLLIALIIISFLLTKHEIYYLLKKSLIFWGILMISQSFWTVPFLGQLLNTGKSIGNDVLSNNVSSTFIGTVLSTASGNIVYPMLNLFHRQIAFDFNWPLKQVFLSYYDIIKFINIGFIVVFFVGIIISKKYLSLKQFKLYIGFLVAFLVSLFLFTVNIGPLKYLFLIFGEVPGFVMFRNFYDKFALGYVFYFAIIISWSLTIIVNHLKHKRLLSNSLLGVFAILIFLNVLPISRIINKPLWTTRNIYTNITIPDEYLHFMQEVKQRIPNTSNILSLPFNVAGYTIIKDTDSNNVFAGRSPVQLFTGINDYSGNLSFSSAASSEINSYIIQRDYNNLNVFLQKYNVGYVFLTNNIPEEVRKSYLFDKKTIKYQDAALISNITSGKILESKRGSYVLYEAKYKSQIIEGKNIDFQKISPVEYRISIHNFKESEQVVFKDSYNTGWKLYPEKILKSIKTEKIDSLVHPEEISFLWSKPFFTETHNAVNPLGNSWTIDEASIKNSLNNEYYRENKDGSIDAIFTLYFYPQLYFYIGTLISALTFLTCFGYLGFAYLKMHERK